MAKSADYGLGEYAFPRGWFMVGTSAEATTTPAAIRFFGEDLVLYRGASGRVFLIAACALSLIQTQGQLYILRVLIGFAEGGLSSGLMLYLGHWAPERWRGSATPC